MGKLYSIIWALLIVLWSPAAFGQTGYEWWLDNDLGGRKSGTFSGDRLDLQVDMSGLSEGLHGFNCRINRADGTWGSIYRQTVLIPTSRTKSVAQAYEYWIDDSYASKVSGSLSAGANAYTVDLQGLKEGLHSLNYRVRTQYDEWSSIYCQYFLIPESTPKTNAKAQSFEYWIDDDYASKVSGNLSSGANAYTIDLQGFEQGLHRLNYRVCTQYGDWSSIHCQYFYNVIESNEPRVVSYEYWLDNDRANRKTGTLDANQITLPIDISGLDKTSDFHLFNMRIGDNFKGWGSVYQKILVFNDHKDDKNIIGYRHRVNGIDLGFIEVNGGLTDSQTFMVDLPKDLKFETSYSGSPTFNGDKVSVEGSDSIHYSIQAKSKMGWSAPRIWDFALSREFSTTAVNMAVNSSRDFDVPESGTFAAVKFISTGVPLYFRANVPVALDVYRNGEKVREFSAEEIAGMVSVELEGGEYFGLLRDVAESDAKRFTFHLMDTPNAVPVPEITFGEGMVAITCSRADALIRYTLDGNDPDSESQLYEEPFEMKRNGTIKAKAWVEGSDIEPSAVAEYTVDTYKTAAPVAKFDLDARLLTLTSETKGATIRYTFEFDESDLNGGVWTDYEESIQIRKNCTVYSRAVFEGYKDSDITVTEITSLASSVAAPEIQFADALVTISCANADAEIHYTIDDPNLTAASPLYTEPIRLERNSTIRAFALIPGLDIEPSDIVTRVIDSFKAATPNGSFNPELRTLELSCSTEGASVSYTFDLGVEWTPYSGPIAITKNCTVYAKASRDGWNDSEVAEIRITELADNVPAPEISFEDGLVSISCANADAEIHYTIDDPNLTAASPLYTEPIRLERNATIRAFAFIPGLDIEPSDIVTYVVDSYKVNKPEGTFNAATRELTITCATENARIFYAFDKPGEWTPYSDPISITKNCTVYAYAAFDGYNDSDVAEIAVTALANSVAAPAIDFTDGKVTITCSTKDSKIRYTIDDEDITVDSPEYTGAFAIDRNCTIRAFAFIPGLDIEPSGVTTKVIDSFKVKEPTGSFNVEARELTLSCETEDAKIFYSFDPDGDWTEYTAPISITKNRTVYAKATRDGWNDSEVAPIVISDVKCDGVTFGDYDGRNVSLSTAENGAAILYTTDGSEPSGANGQVYDGEFDAEGLRLIRAVAVKDGYMNSDEAQLRITFYADEEHAETAAEGLLASAFGWNRELPAKVTDFRIEGRLNEADYAFIRTMGALRHLDLGSVAEARIPDNAFRDSRLISISLPADLAECGDSILSGAPLLSSVIWNSRSMDVGEGLTGGLENPNVLLYVPTEVNVSGRPDLNIVREGSEPSVTLHYGYPYYAALEFHAGRVSLTHEFTQTTVPGICRGWETIVLPFSPTGIIHEVNGPAVPFAAWDEDINGDKPFWLYRANDTGWEAAPSIEACVPYIISMPNSSDYINEFNLGGKVTFSAEGVYLGPDRSLAMADSWINGTQFEGTFMPVEDNSVLSLNVGSTEGGLQPGSTFVPDGHTDPFGAFVSGGGRKAMPLFGDASSVDLPLTIDAGLLIETPAPGVLRICSGRERRVAVTTATGVTIRTLSLKPGEAVTLEGLTRDLYIVAGRKVMVR